MIADLLDIVEKMRWHKFLDKDPAHLRFRDLVAHVVKLDVMYVDA